MARDDKDEEILRAQNKSQLELIKVNVEKVKKDVSEVSTFTKKEIDSVIKKMEQLISKIEKSQEAAMRQNKSAYDFMLSSQEKLSVEQEKAMMKQVRDYQKLSVQIIKNDEEHLKALEKQRQYNKENMEAITQTARKVSQNRVESQQATQNMIQQVLKGNFTGITSALSDKRIAGIEAKMNQADNDFMSGKMSLSQYKSTMSGLTDNMSKLQNSAKLFNYAAQAISTMADIWIKRFEAGMNNIVDKYESTFQAQAVQTGINEKEYFRKQKEMQDSLNKQGLQNNIAISEVMQATSDYVNSGVTNMAQAMQLGEQSAITKSLAPYLDTQSDAYVSLSQMFGPKFQKSIAGIGAAVSDSVGQNRFTVKNLSSIIDMLNPIMLASEKEILGQDELAYLESMKAKGYSEQAVLQMMHDVKEIKENPLGVLDNGNITQKMLAARGADYVANADLTDLMYESQNLYSELRGNATGYEKAALLKATGLEGTHSWLMSNQREDSINKESYNIARSAANSTTAYQNRLAKLAQDQYTTAKTEKDILAENLSLDVAIAQEKWPDLIKAVKEILPGIASLFATWAGGKLFSGLFGKSGSGFMSGLGSKATNSIGSGLMNVGLAMNPGSQSVAGSIATGAAGVAGTAALIGGGSYLAYDGIKDVGNDFKNGKTARGVADIAEIGGGAVAAGTATVAIGSSIASGAGLSAGIAAAATNPIGWVALAIAGIGLAGKAAYDYAEYCKKSTDATEELNAQTEEQLRNMKASHKTEMDALNEYNQKIQKTTDVETAKQLIIDSGIATEAELQSEQYKSIDALKELTQQYINSKNTMNEDSEKYLQGLKEMTNQKQNEFIGEYLKKYGEDKDHGDLTYEDKQSINEYGLQMQKYIEDLVNSGEIDNESNKHAKYMWEHGILDKNYYDDNLTEDDYRILFREGTNADRRVVGKNMLAKDKYYNSLLASGTYTKKVLGYKYDYDTINSNEEQISKYLSGLRSAALSGDKGSVEGYIQSLKLAGVNSINDIPEKYRSEIQSALDSVGASYAIGSDYIRSNGQFAYLHEGEAVLTKSAAALLRSRTNVDISSVSGVADALSANSTMTKEQVSSIVTAISNQTIQLIQKMDQILNSISANRRMPTYNQSLINLGSTK